MGSELERPIVAPFTIIVYPDDPGAKNINPG